ncbi:helix-turn-helix transcriptional regulator [Clostridium sp.]|uniref:helix-turn-helix domain-containing protein n=1 Tax=Clostridium sp. TaxID=1506 RepID=UPI00262A4AAA|nr:helix-turn-helix transcriptional regulator [Clostridium sp.]
MKNLNIKIARIEKGFSQQELAKILGISRNKLSILENGNFENLTYPLIKKFLKVLDIDLNKIFTE